MHWQGASVLRVRRQGLDRHHAESLQSGQFIANAKALPGNPYDGHTLATVIPEIETQIGANLTGIVVDRGYRGHNAPPDHKFKVYISGERRLVTETIKRELRRRSAVEPVIGHAKAEHRMGRNYLAWTNGDAANAVLPAAGYNFRRLLEWLAFLSQIRRPQRRRQSRSAAQTSLNAFFTDD
jgi:IS5 family transposase